MGLKDRFIYSRILKYGATEVSSVKGYYLVINAHMNEYEALEAIR